jgi:hypothetical protein
MPQKMILDGIFPTSRFADEGSNGNTRTTAKPVQGTNGPNSIASPQPGKSDSTERPGHTDLIRASIPQLPTAGLKGKSLQSILL